ncbi:MAG: putative Anaerobic glycerol-3-phosphate dehydrogenase subunit A [Promethearchaeota archaeon]|nr:MAG: putative Anaerobic glycerol-3-phosphate dehydrogenase subunit A [Candidatus Lokiarchaeota archaeon]
MKETKYDCIIVGGGITGVGIARDLSLRGLKLLLVEKNDLSEGTTGRCHAMLHSGARYVYKDKEAALECAQENKILLTIAPHITEPCGGYFIAVNSEDMDYGDIFRTECEIAGVWCEEINPQTFLSKEPNCNPHTIRVFKVNDGYIDPFLLTYYNAYDAQLHGATIKAYTKAERLLLDGDTIIGIECFNVLTKRRNKYYTDIIINATGPWSSYLEKDLSLSHPLKIAPTMGTLVVVKDRLVNGLINRLRPPGDGDIIVPSHNSVIVGTTSIPVEYEQLDTLRTTPDEIDYILTQGEYLVPTLKKHRIIRFYSGARPLIDSGASLREASRRFDIIDYEKEGYSGFLTIIGGKLTTYRLMAKEISDLVVSYLDIDAQCSTADQPLPGGDRLINKERFEEILKVDKKTAFDMQFKWGTFYKEIFEMCERCMDPFSEPNIPQKICECENVTEPELSWVRERLAIKVLDDYRRRTRQGMGPCQGIFCYYKLANLEAKHTEKTHAQIMNELKIALQKRWKIQYAADDVLKRQIKLSKYIYLLGGHLK